MISIHQALAVHNIIIEKFGGSKGVRDNDALDASLNRPFATFDQQDLYPTQ